MTDELLFGKFQKDLDNESFEILIQRHSARAFAFSKQLLNDAASAEDALQEAFLRIVRARDRYDPSRSFRAWFYRILRNCCVDQLRLRMRSIENASGTVSDVKRDTYYDNRQELQVSAISALDTVPSIMREALMLRIWENLSFYEIGHVCRCSTEAAKKRVQRALSHLRKTMLSREAGEEHPESSACTATGQDLL